MQQPPASGLKTRRFTLFQRFYERYALEPPPASETVPPAISTLLYGAIDISDLYPPELLKNTLDLNVTLGQFVEAFTVPERQRWRLALIATPATNVNTGVFLRDPPGSTIRFSLGATAVVVFNTAVSHINLEPGWSIGLSGTNDVGDNARALDIMIRRELLD